MPKYDRLSNLLRVRLLNGDYALRTLPAERQLAVEHGVSYMTARRAVQDLIEAGLLVRGPNGRLEVNVSEESVVVSPLIALLSPTYTSSGFDNWRHWLEEITTEAGGKLRHVLYTHWDDPVLMESLENFQGIFLLPSSEPMPQSFIARLAESNNPVIVLDDDLSEFGLPSIRPFPPEYVFHLLNHLEVRGCRSIDCLNVQPMHSVVEQRIALWREWMALHEYAGELINDPVQPYTPPYARAYEAMQARLESGQFNAQALFCITTPAAVGAMRALHDAGIRPGVDVAVCALDGENMAAFQNPSLTALEASDVTGQLRSCVEWMMGPRKKWKGPLLLQPDQPRLEIRESTAFSVAAVK